MPALFLPVSLYCVLTVQMWLLGAGGLRRLNVWNGLPLRLANPWMKTGLAMSLGFSFDAIWMFVLGEAGILTPVRAMAGLLVGTLASAVVLRPTFRSNIPMSGPVLLAAFILFVGFCLFALRAPGYWDDTMYHLPLARVYSQEHRLVLAPFLRFPLFPQYMDLMLTLGLLLAGSGGVLLAQGLATLPLFMVGLGLIGVFESSLDMRWPGFAATLVLLVLGPVRDTLGYGYIDNGLILFCWMALLCLMLACDGSPNARPDKRLLGLAGFFAGMAAGTKYFGLPFAGLMGLWLLLSVRNWRSVLAFGLPVIAVAGGWYLRSYLISGDPLHPAGGRQFGFFLWNAQDLLLQQKEQATHGGQKNLLHVFSGLKSAGITVFVLTPLSFLWWTRLSRGMRLMLLVSVSYFLFWFHVTQVDRYIAPAAAAGVLFAVWPLAFACTVVRDKLGPLRATSRWWAVSGSVLCLVLAGNLVFRAGKQFVLQQREWTHILDSRPGYGLMMQADSASSVYGQRLIQIGFEGVVYFFDGVAIGDWFGPGRYAQMLQCRNADCRLLPAVEMLALMQRFGARMLIINTASFRFDQADYLRHFRLLEQDAYGVLLAVD